MFVQVVTLVGTVGVIASLLFDGLQSREIARQTRIQNAIAGASGKVSTNELLHSILRIFVDHPELRGYFYDGLAVPTDEATSGRVLTVAEMLADVFDTALLTTSLIDATDSYESWRRGASYFMRQSPALAAIVNEHGEWFPNLTRLKAKPSIRNLTVASLGCLEHPRSDQEVGMVKYLDPSCPVRAPNRFRERS